MADVISVGGGGGVLKQVCCIVDMTPRLSV